MSIFTLVPGVTPDDWDDYESGCNDQRDRCEKEAHILAFGAIRRAAKVARSNDEEAHRHRLIVKRMIDNDPECRNAEHNPTCDRHRQSARVYEERAKSVRFAIRAAIKSPWLMLEPWQTRREP